MMADDFLSKMDTPNIGTKKYLGYARFWHNEYDEVLKNQDDFRLRLLHRILISSNLGLKESSKRHLRIIKQLCR